MNASQPTATTDHGEGRHFRLSGDWTAANAAALEPLAAQIVAGASGAETVLDLSGIGRIDTIGAVVLDDLRTGLSGNGGQAVVQTANEEQRALLDAVSGRCREKPEVVKEPSHLIEFLDAVGRGVVSAGHDLRLWVGFLGAIMATLGYVLLHPRRFRFTSFVHHLDLVGLRAVPIIALISFLVGAIVAQQSIFQLRSFGATIFVVDLIGILTLRELGVLLTSIMLAGRSGSAFTAELGSMKMREEIDALRVMGLDPVEVLVLPRLMALVVALTLLAFISELASMAGGAFVANVYGGISLSSFLARLHEALTMSSFVVGMIKAPFMGLVIALIATIEGMAVEGSAESLGAHTTSSVVKAIFMVIVLDGIFAMLFAAIGM